MWKNKTACYILFVFVCTWPVQGFGQTPLRMATSAQVAEAFDESVIEAFTKKTGIPVDLFICSSDMALMRVANGICDLATTAKGVPRKYLESGIEEIPFCRDALCVVVERDFPVNELSTARVLDIFSKRITNWKRVDGPDMDIRVIVPGTDTGAYYNFQNKLMRLREIQYDFATYRSTAIVKGVTEIPGAVSFIGQAAVYGNSKVKTLAIDGHPAWDPDYPCYQIFSFITLGPPKGSAKTFIGLAASKTGLSMIRERGMEPLFK